MAGRHRRPRRRPATGWVLAAVGAAALVVALLQVLTSTASGTARASDVGTVPPAGQDVQAGRAGPSDGAVDGTSNAGAPVRLSVPSVGIDAPVTPVETGEDLALGVPDDVHTLGWWSGGATVGAPVGTVVLDGHVDSARQGLGALARLRDVVPGAVVHVSTPTGSRDYRVAARRSYGKSALPADLFDRSSAPRLLLITCGGSFDRVRHRYSDNVVVFAVPL